MNLILEAFADTPMFYQHLIGPTPPTATACKRICNEVLEESLLACSDGAYDAATGKGSHGWVITSEIEQETAASGTGPDDGHPHLMSYYYCIELGGIIAVL
jgi:hypothetical protein